MVETKTLPQRLGPNLGIVRQTMEKISSENTFSEVLALAKEFDLVLAPMLSLEDAVAEPQVVHNKLLTKHTHPDCGVC